MIIRTNIPSLNANRNLNSVSGKQEKTSQRLASGLRINSAADDSSGLAISEKMRAQIRGLNQAERNIQDGVSLLNVADGALQVAQNIVHRMRELAVQACNDTNTDDDRMKLNEEYVQLCNELDRIAQDTEFNNRKLFSGEYAREIFKGLEIAWAGAVENDSLNFATSEKPDMKPSDAPTSLTTEISGEDFPNGYDSYTIDSFPDATETPKAALTSRTAAGELTGDQSISSTKTTKNIGGKIVATGSTTELTVTENTSYKENLDNSWAIWQGQKQIKVSTVDSIYYTQDGEEHTLTEDQVKSGGIWGVYVPEDGIKIYDENGNEISRFDAGGNEILKPGMFVEGAWVIAEEMDKDAIVETIEDHYEAVSTNNKREGDRAAKPKDWNPKTINNTPTRYTWAKMINQGPEAILPDLPIKGDAVEAEDNANDEWERAEIDSTAFKTTVTKNTGGAIYVRNTADGAQTHIGYNIADQKYNLSSITPPYPQARVDTNTQIVTVGTNSTQATVVSRNQSNGSKFNSTTNSGTIYAGAEYTEINTNETGGLVVNPNGSSTSKLVVKTKNSGTLYSDSYAAEVKDNSGYIYHLNKDANSSFSLPGTQGTTDTNSGFILTYAQKVDVYSNTGSLYTTNDTVGSELTITDANSGTIYTKAETVIINNNDGGTLVTTNDTTASRLDVTTNTGTILTAAVDVNIETNGGELLLSNSKAVVEIDNTTTGSRIDTFAQQLTINGNANGSIRVEPGATVDIKGNNNATVSILPGGTLNVTGNLDGTVLVGSGATLKIDGNITGTLYIEAGANVSFKDPLADPGKIFFLGDPNPDGSFSPNPLNVAGGGVVELQNTTTIDIGENNGTVMMFNSTASIADNKGVLQVDNDATATVSANSGAILNLGEVKEVVPNVSPNTGTIDNWNKINPSFTNGSGSINHHAPFATDNDTYDVSGVNFPNVVNGELVPSVQTSVIKLVHNEQEYTLTAEWKAVKSLDDVEMLCDCTVGAHNKTECSDHDLGLLADAFELKFNLDSIAPELQQGERFVFWPNPALNADSMRYDIDGRTVTYNVDAFASIRESWENGDGLWIHTGANTDQGHNIYLPDLTHGMTDITKSCVICDCGSLKSADLLNYPNASAVLDICDKVNSHISNIRGYIGAQTNRLMYAGDCAAISSENLSSAESRIRDADMAKEMMQHTKNNILSQAGISLLAQSNQNPQTILQLLG